MPTPASVLVFSRDTQLLNTRCLILRQAGYKAFPASTLAEVHHWLSEPLMDVVLLCHTLTTEECDETILLTHALWPGVQVVALLAGQSGCSADADATVNSSDGPVQLIRTIQKHLN